MEIEKDNLFLHLQGLGYNAKACEKDLFEKALETGLPNKLFIDIITFLSSELAAMCNLENFISCIGADDSVDIGFFVELSSLLKELGCPFKHLFEKQVKDRFVDAIDKVTAVWYLCQELEAEKIIAINHPKKVEAVLKIELIESKPAKELKEMLISLKFGKPPDNITPQKLFSETEKKLFSLSQPLAPKSIVGELLFTGCLTEKQWFQLDKLYKEIFQEYRTRRNLLLTRLDVTVKSFLWAERLKEKSEEVINSYNKLRSGVTDEPNVNVSNILSATSGLIQIEKTSSALVRKNTTTKVHKVIIGSVPDRGGRPAEQQPPPPEIPSWQKNEASCRGGMNQTSYRGSDRNPQFRSNESISQGSYSSNDTYQSRGNCNNRNNFNRGRGPIHSQPAVQLVYQPAPLGNSPYSTPLGNQYFGFGGYVPAGDNFQQYGTTDTQYVKNFKANYGGHNDRGNYNDRVGSGSRLRGRGHGQSRGQW